jgi:hypothetical protein
MLFGSRPKYSEGFSRRGEGLSDDRRQPMMVRLVQH